MNVDRLKPSGPNSLDPKGPKKGPSKVEGKSFSAAFDKAKAIANPAPAPEAAAQAAAPEAPSNAAGAPMAADVPAADYMDTIRFRLQSGYYKSSGVDDALSDKLSGYFDEIA